MGRQTVNIVLSFPVWHDRVRPTRAIHPGSSRHNRLHFARPHLGPQVGEIFTPGVEFRKDLDQVLEGIEINQAAALADGEQGRRPIAATVGTYKKRIFSIETGLAPQSLQVVVVDRDSAVFGIGAQVLENLRV